MNDVAKNLEDVRSRILAACRATGRDPATVTLLAISKFHPPEAIRAAYEAGQRDFGENYVQELAAKAEALAKVAEPGAPIRVHLQVNVGEEAQKSGCTPEELPALVASVRALPGLVLEGLMTIPPASDDPEATRPHFRRLRELARAHGLSGLSMGMSHDLEVAIEEGATSVRVGTAIFGERA